MEKITESFTVAALQSHSCGGVGLEDKQKMLLSNRTLLGGKHSEKTQNGMNMQEEQLLGSSHYPHQNSWCQAGPSGFQSSPVEMLQREEEASHHEVWKAHTHTQTQTYTMVQSISPALCV